MDHVEHAAPPPPGNPVHPTTPFVLEPLLVERIWGTRDLAPWHGEPPAGMVVGEIWLTAENCRAQGGALAGQTLAEITRKHPEVLGDPRGEGFPLLLKFLFPSEKLSVQVHPNDAEAKALGMPRGKTECWYVLSAEPGAELSLGFREPLTPDQVRAAIADGSLESKLRQLPVKTGDMVFVDAGTVHAIGPGMVVLETQQYSDTTYRLWDYGRPRPLHVDAGTAVTKNNTRAGRIEPERREGFERLASSPYFAVDRFSLQPGAAAALGAPGQLQILVALEEGSRLQSGPGAALPLPRGQAVVVPAAAAGYTLTTDTALQVMRILQP